MKAEDLARRVLDTANKLRRIQREVASREFQLVWDNSSESQRAEVLGYIDKLNEADIKAWQYRYRFNKPIAELNTTELRELAKRHHIPYYAQKTTRTLIQEIEYARALAIAN